MLNSRTEIIDTENRNLFVAIYGCKWACNVWCNQNKLPECASLPQTPRELSDI